MSTKLFVPKIEPPPAPAKGVNLEDSPLTLYSFILIFGPLWGGGGVNKI